MNLDYMTVRESSRIAKTSTNLPSSVDGDWKDPVMSDIDNGGVRSDR
jgi:hypothetical protein